MEQELEMPVDTDIAKGLTETEAAQRLEQYGPNAIETQKKESLFLLFIRQFKSLIVAILALAAVVSFSFGDWLEGFAIIGVLLINAITGFILEWQAMRSMDALKELDVTMARVIRDANVKEIPSEKVTIGDIIWLEAGDIVPADAHVVEANQLQSDESALTGESLPVEKKPGEPDENAPLAEQIHRLFKGTAVVNGNGKAIVTDIGAKTELGKISKMVESATQTSTPLEKKLESLTQKLIWVTAVLAVLYFVFGLLQGKDLLTLLKTSIALAIAAIPEGLAIVATISLAYGMLRLAKKNVIIKRLSSVETLGSANVVFSDKTGTLTLNQIEVNTICLPEGTLEVRVNTEDKKQALVSGDGELVKNTSYQKLVELSVLCNNAHITPDTNTGDPLEIALLQWIDLQQIHAEDLTQKNRRINEIAFSSETRIMATIHQNEAGYLVAVKGAVEEVLSRCNNSLDAGQEISLDEAGKKKWVDISEQLAAKGLRSIAFAFRQTSTLPADDALLQDLTWVAMIGFLDPPRLEVVPSLKSCHDAGIRVIMVTGDHPSTAQHIGETIGLTDASVKPMTGRDIPDLKQLNEKDKKRLLDTRIFARVSPGQKLDLISLYQDQGDIVGMTGDGINDAPALKKADIGIAMGLRGTQVARETADMVLKDDSFVSVVAAIAQGRIIFGNIRKFIMYLVSCNLSEIFVVTASGFLSLGLPLTPLQILFLNVVTDVFPALALGIGKGDSSVMRHSPRDPKSPILSKPHWMAVIIYALLMTGSVMFAAFYSAEVLGINAADDNNIVFYSLSLAQLFHVFNLASGNSGLFRNEITKNRYVWLAVVVCMGILALTYYIPVLREALNIQNLHPIEWIVVLVASLAPLVLIQILKRLRVIW
ncbi:cation-transporting P-type ATPase [Xanthocytophaga agilis]|uniref:Cation-transporting P-type ATPase n=1 Tax=Xanthocytophaga agilis TaxID=3048010 RepID=A0AAE3UIZ2_9BACT|nr:cation-transporting P-type ATPase [Xanthocytophaga agilis]MDJ1506041.1 cation-transporting P-type ATPase [Xanthocytophaga agilis]